MQTLEDARALAEAQHDAFYLKAFAIQGWLDQLVGQAAVEYAERKNRRFRVMQTGQAQRGFLQVFGHVTGAEFNGLLESLYRFTEYSHPLAGILFRALLPLSIEHESSGDFMEPRMPDPTKRPREALALLWRSLERWCDWVDAVVHLRTHAQWHLAPECFRPVPDLSELGGPATRAAVSAPTNLASHAQGHVPRSEPPWSWSDTGQWQLFSDSVLPQAGGHWPFQEVDEAVISLWPLLKRHNWTFGDLLGILRDLLRQPGAQPCRNEEVLAAYCANTLGLHKIGHGDTAKDSRPTGYEVALRLCPPLRQVVPPGEPPWLTESPNSSRPRRAASTSAQGFENRSAAGDSAKPPAPPETPKPEPEIRKASASLDFEV